MQINRENYGAFFLDYWENNLDEQGREALARFLHVNPDLQDEFLDFQNLADVRLPDEHRISFERKDLLKKTPVQPVAGIHQDNYEQFIIAFLENDLSESEKKNFSAFLAANPNVEPEVALFKKTFLAPDRQIRFSGKDRLKKEHRIGVFSTAAIRYAAAALALLLATGAYLFFAGNNQIDQQQLAGSRTAITLPADTVQQKSENRSPDNTPVKVPQKTAPAVQLAVAQNIQPSRIPVHPPEKRISSSYIVKQPPIQPVKMNDRLYAMASAPDTKPVTGPRTEVSSVFGYMLLRDEMVYEGERGTKEKSTFGKVLANFFNKTLGLGPDNEDPLSSSLLAEVSRKGRETISEVSDRIPFFRKKQEGDQTQTVIGLNDNFSIRRSKGRHNNNSESNQ